VWRDELAAIARDLRGWLEGLAQDGEQWLPERFEFAFGLPGDANREPAIGRRSRTRGWHGFRIRGSIDLRRTANLGGNTLLRVNPITGPGRPHTISRRWLTAAAC
jgi:hypothetical protein